MNILKTAMAVIKCQLREQRVKALAATEREIDRLSYHLAVALLAAPGPRHPQYGVFHVNLAKVEKVLEKKKARRAHLQTKLGVKIG